MTAALRTPRPLRLSGGAALAGLLLAAWFALSSLGSSAHAASAAEEHAKLCHCAHCPGVALCCCGKSAGADLCPK